MTNNILILSNAREGKDTFAEMLAGYMGTTFTSSSLAAADVILPMLRAAIGKDYTDALEAFNDRFEHRMIWKEAICLLNYIDKTALAKIIYSKCNMYVGLRDDLEYEACLYKGLFNTIFWVDASKRIKINDPTMKVKFDPTTMILIDNNQGLQELDKQAKYYADKLRGV